MQPKRRKAIPWRTKCEAALNEIGLTISDVHFDHHPALALREWDEQANDTIPAANDPRFIRVLRIEEHKVKTTGRKGESRFSGIGKGDAQEIAKARRKLLAPAERPKPRKKAPPQRRASSPLERPLPPRRLTP